MAKLYGCENASIIVNAANRKACPELIKGEIWQNKYECVLPNIIYNVDGSYIETEQLLGKNIAIHKTTEYYNGESWDKTEKDYVFKVTGIYQIDEGISNKTNNVYAPISSVKNIIEDSKWEEIGNKLIVTVDSVQNIEEVKHLLQEKEIAVKSMVSLELNANAEAITTTENFYTQSQIAPKYMRILIFASCAITAIMISLSILITVIQNIKSIYNSKKEIGILKAIGYKNSQIQKTILVRNLYIITLAVIIAIFVFNIAIGIGQAVIDSIAGVQYKGITQREMQRQIINISKILVPNSCIVYIISILITYGVVAIVSYFTSRKVLKIEIAEILAEGKE